MKQRFTIHTRKRAAANAKRLLSQSYMGRDNKHIAILLPDNPTPDEVDKIVQEQEAVDQYTFRYCEVCETKVETCVVFKGRYDKTWNVCEACITAASSRIKLVIKEEN
jgi:hypothetical protein